MSFENQQLDTYQILWQARQKLLEGRWTTGHFARDKHNVSCKTQDSNAVSFCALGACFAVAHENEMGAGERSYMARCLLNEAAMERGCGGVAGFNDTHTKAEVIQLFDEALEKAKKAGASCPTS